MSKHPSKIHVCSGPNDPHAFMVIPKIVRTGDLDEQCPTCEGHGQWNTEIDLVSLRSKRTACGHCEGRGWIETGTDKVAYPDIILSLAGHPMWVTKYK